MPSLPQSKNYVGQSTRETTMILPNGTLIPNDMIKADKIPFAVFDDVEVNNAFGTTVMEKGKKKYDTFDIVLRIPVRSTGLLSAIAQEASNEDAGPLSTLTFRLLDSNGTTRQLIASYAVQFWFTMEDGGSEDTSTDHREFTLSCRPYVVTDTLTGTIV